MIDEKEVKERYDSWLKCAEDISIKRELLDIKDNKKEINERFYKMLEFGTAGLRGIMGAGTNRMNIYTVRLATQGLANFLLEKYGGNANKILVAISYDSRNNSELFAKETAKVMAGNGIKSYITGKLQPTPFLSFCVRKLKAKAGVMITASHNTAEYNGYKCYGEDGAQISENLASKIYKKISDIDIFSGIKLLKFEDAMKANLVHFVEADIYDDYIKNVMNQRILDFPISNLCAVYTPLNGAGNIPVREVLGKSGLKDLYVVPQQESPDGNFTTCPYPNPENLEAFSEALKLAKEKNADIIIATDPDCDRLGICVKHEGEYKLLSGNEIGALIFSYILERRKENNTLPQNAVAVKSIVSTMMVDKIANEYGCEMREVLTGFKNIAAEILKLEKSCRESDYIFGFEESNGYLLGTYSRDKDAVSAALIVCELASYYKEKGLDLYEVVRNLWEKYGVFGEKTLSFEFKGIEGKHTIENIMARLRNNFLEEFKKLDIVRAYDYSKSEMYDIENKQIMAKNLPCSDILRFDLKNGSKIIVRPSGTEPKIKFYLIMQSNSIKNLENCKLNIQKVIEQFLLTPYKADATNIDKNLQKC